ncbi:hypothetical protein H7Y63_02630 [Polaromonas sp.]|nr:hypothetical protein [Candidatus Saccharibacteria bacterium]
MPVLPQVEAILDGMAAQYRPAYGEHDSSLMRVGLSGKLIGEVDFDPARHGLQDINPLSVWGDIMGVPQVGIVVPEYPLPIGVVIDQSSQEDHPGILKAKQMLGRQLLRCFDESALVSDDVAAYVIGENANFPRDYRTETIPEREAAERVSEICSEGLTFIISDFAHLELVSGQHDDFPATVAVKINQPFELALPANKGKIPLGPKSKPVNTNRPKELAAYNNDQARSHEAIIQRLQSAGIRVAQVLFDATKGTTLGLNVKAADSAIASAMQGFDKL